MVSAVREVMFMPITLFYAATLALLLVFLSLQVLRVRVRATADDPDAAARITRVQANFVEYVPMTLILMALIEAAGAPALALHCMGCSLVVARIAHAYGLGRLGSRNYPRTLGALGTFLILAIAGFAGLFIATGGLLLTSGGRP